MANSTILRVKRRLEDNPQDAFVLTCKRAKTDNDIISPLFVFRATVDNQDSLKVKELSKCDVKLRTSNNVTDIIEKIRMERKDVSSESRYKIVKCSRGLEESLNDDNYNLVDLEKSKEEDNVQYAYDLYIAEKQEFDISMLDNLVSIENYESELIFGSHRDNGRRTPISDDGENSDDSNDENNWRNEYPNTDTESINEDDMVQAMQRCDMDSLSSDDEDKIYDDQPDLFSTEDANLYGVEYAMYKARVLSEDPKVDKNSLIHYSKIKDHNESVGYKDDDSDDGFYYGQDDAERCQEEWKHDKSDENDPD